MQIEYLYKIIIKYTSKVQFEFEEQDSICLSEYQGISFQAALRNFFHKRHKIYLLLKPNLSTKVKPHIAYLVNVRMIYFGEKSDLLEGIWLNTNEANAHKFHKGTSQESFNALQKQMHTSNCNLMHFWICIYEQVTKTEKYIYQTMHTTILSN